LDNLIQSVLLDKCFDQNELCGYSTTKMNVFLDGMEGDIDGPQLMGEGWKRNVSVPIQIPEGKAHWMSPEGRTFDVPSLHHCSIMGIIRATFSSMSNLHFTPFMVFWKPPGASDDTPEHRVHGEIYSSPAFREAHEEVQSSKYKVPGCNLEHVVASLMFWSDLTHLPSFGTAKLWPIYMFFRNHS
jgi:hypothetical protein